MPDFLLPAESPDDWRRFLAKPETQWKTGRSAKALAYCWQAAGGFPPEVQTLLSSSGIELFERLEMILAIPELRVPLPGGRRASQTDLFILAKSGSELVSIAVEGKVEEEFDELVSAWLVRPTRRNESSRAPELDPAVVPGVGADEASAPMARVEPSTGKLERLSYLCTTLGIAEAEAHGLRYQLLHRTASALIEAEVFNAAHAVMLVHSFSPTHTWFEDYRAFAQILGVEAGLNEIVHVGERAGVELYLGWVTGEARWLEV